MNYNYQECHKGVGCIWSLDGNICSDQAFAVSEPHRWPWRSTVNTFMFPKVVVGATSAPGSQTMCRETSANTNNASSCSKGVEVIPTFQPTLQST
ncbi:hypothetical protein HHI36_008252 [Cryptolaemus montrouzieri]|uniref:Uncharacterized protein n=1 Tax=Cryptolaemus montrouzieri TaxID=559131 RepID=A0ABD2MS58_9CUCU